MRIFEVLAFFPSSLLIITLWLFTAINIPRYMESVMGDGFSFSALGNWTLLIIPAVIIAAGIIISVIEDKMSNREERKWLCENLPETVEEYDRMVRISKKYEKDTITTHQEK